ncbi:MAG: peptide chain release factor N(5)-glutamine methyltransferase [bacterium]|nr:peptide chain release factor N(5)-glutamine methyltransferase [bacterium]
MITYFQLFNKAAKELAACSDEPEIEAEILLCHAFEITRESFLSFLNEEVKGASKTALFNSCTASRKQGMPVCYITRKAFFMNNQYSIDQGVLIPRPETELLVEKTHKLLLSLKKKYTTVNVLELGSGSGIIAVELALRHPDISIYSWEISATACKQAKINIFYHQTSNIELIHKDFFKDSARWSQMLKNSHPVILVSNPPYIAAKDIQGLDPSVKYYEPEVALCGGSSGIDFYKKIFKAASTGQNVYLALEIGVDQKKTLSELLSRHHFKDTVFFSDLNRIPRVLISNTEL